VVKAEPPRELLRFAGEHEGETTMAKPRSDRRGPWPGVSFAWGTLAAPFVVVAALIGFAYSQGRLDDLGDNLQRASMEAVQQIGGAAENAAD
jgi:hypothetical protein